MTEMPRSPLNLRNLVGSTTCAMAAVNLAVAFGGCPHADAEPVESGGETVAWLCPGCDTQLPAEWSTS